MNIREKFFKKDLDIPAQNETANTSIAEIIGQKTDTYTLGGAVPDNATWSVMRLLDYIIKAFSFQFAKPTADTADNNFIKDIIGNKNDTIAGDSIVSLEKQNIALNDTTDATGTMSYLDAGAEQTIIELTPTTRKIINGIWLDLVNMTQDGTIKLYYKIDGTNYREFDSIDFTVATDSDGQYISINAGITSSFKVTYTEGADEGAARDIPYSIIYENKEF